jgi:hypothetical protein
VNRLVARTGVVRTLIKPTLAAACVGVALYFLRDFRLVATFPLAAALYLGVLLLLRTFSSSEFQQLRALAVWVGARLRGGRAADGNVAAPGRSWLEDREG